MLHSRDLALLTDLYELTMAQSYFRESKFQPATFSLFVRKYPPNRAFFVSCGLEDVLHYLESLHFGTESIDYLHRTGIFADDFLEYLKQLRFTGDVWAIPEGRLFFVDEPVVEVTAPIIEAQIVETFIMNQINLQTLISVKAARCVYAARGRRVVDFALRRTHGTDAGMKVARSSYIAGFTGTSNVLAGKVYGIPVVGTMAHSYVTSFLHEVDAFRAFVRSFPQNATLLIDTFDTLGGAHKAVKIAREMAANGNQLQAVRIDSGDMASLGREVRQILDEAELTYVQIVGSGGLDEYQIDELCRQDVPYDSFGVGTRMGVSADAPWTDMAYKLVRYDGRPILKLSTGKVSLPDEKQVHRSCCGGQLASDVIALRVEKIDGGAPLLRQAMAGGSIIGPLPSLDDIRNRFHDEFSLLDEKYKNLNNPSCYPVSLSPGLQTLKQQIELQVFQSEMGAASTHEGSDSTSR